jgi:hypothetical protein
MTVTPSDLTSLTNTLSLWEAAEYACAGLVTIACIGEYAAHFTSWFTGGIEERKQRLAKRFTLLLAAALSFEFICLVRTNVLSGKVIGSLNDQAEEAGKKARRAIEDSTAAITRSEQARTAARLALDQSGRAKESASNALVLARGARQEADSFAKDIVLAKQQAAEAELALAAIKGDRVISPGARTKLENELARFKGTQFDLLVFRDSESIGLMSSLREILISPKVGWVQIPSPEMFYIPNLTPRVGLTLFSGVEIAIDKSRTEWRPAVAAIVRILKEDGILTEGLNAVTRPNAIHIIVGSKPKRG